MTKEKKIAEMDDAKKLEKLIELLNQQKVFINSREAIGAKYLKKVEKLMKQYTTSLSTAESMEKAIKLLDEHVGFIRDKKDLEIFIIICTVNPILSLQHELQFKKLPILKGE